MSDRAIEQLRLRADACLERNDLDGAIEAIDPDLADLHGLLAICLVDRRLLAAARAEADLALVCDPMDPLAQRANGHVQLAEGKRREALRSFELALELEPDFVHTLIMISRVKRMLGQPGEAELARALELEPESPTVLAEYSSLEFDRGNLDAAYGHARDALEIDPEHGDALLAMGWVLLRRGELDDAREHAVMALRANPSDPDALRLLAAYKARRSWFLGLWFRWNMAMSAIGDRNSIIVMLAMFVIYRVAKLVLEDLELEHVGEIVTWIWLAIVVYTWVGPAVFNQMLKRELEQIRLDPKY
jgi:tetratricopeptide (TPR) repeat protein